MELYTHSKLSTVERERLELLKNRSKIQVGFISFDSKSKDSILKSPLHFKRGTFRYYVEQSSNPGDFALLPVQSSGVVGQGALS